METARVNAAAWPILLQHDSIGAELRVAAKLMCCSKELAAAVAEHCAGRLAVMYKFWHGEARKQQVERWLLKHARLLRELNSRSFNKEFLQALVAAGPQQLQLQSLTICGAESLALLERLPAHHLTRLHLDPTFQGEQLPQHAARMLAAISRLTALQHLGLGWYDSSHVLPGLSALCLPGLTSLVSEGPPSSLHTHLPAQLRQLDIADYDTGNVRSGNQPLDLRHLTALTALNAESERCFSVLEGDVLPPSLVQATHCRSVQPLLGLQKLQVLDLGFDTRLDITAQQLATLSGLTSLRLQYEEATEPASAAAWPLLPLKRLRLREAQLPPAACWALGQVTGLTSLVLYECGLADSAAQQQLVAALSRLSRLDLNFSMDLNFSIPCRISSTPQLWQAIGSLRGLACLFVSNVDPVGASVLSGLVALTKLELERCGLSDAALCAGLAQLTGLRSLSVRNNQSLTDVSLPVLGQLHQLTQLSLSSTGVTDAGLRHLAGLSNLRGLHLHCTAVSDAGLPVLAGMTHLQHLGLTFCKGVMDRVWLRQRLPTTEVE